VLLVVEGGHVTVEGTARNGCGGAGKRGKVVVVPCTVEVELVDAIIGPEEDDVLLEVEGSLITNDIGGKCERTTGQIREVVVVQGAVAIKLVDVVVVTNEVDVLLEVEGGRVTVVPASTMYGGNASESCEVVVMPSSRKLLSEVGMNRLQIP
jgi:hypothetical protein